ncbi:MAG: PAS domain S-box protein [Chloroflexi bacterium]|nr:PAS domain S-box protein [Chloroflexota bacterium]
MRKPLRVLLIEDSEADAALLLTQLRMGGYDLTSERVDTLAEVAEAVERQEWDLILSDYSLPGFNGLAALALVQERGVDLPFIIVSGKVGEGMAVAAMKAGAHDYITKNNLTRVLPAIERELGDAKARHERKRALQDLKESEARFRTIFEASALGISLMDNYGRVMESNPALQKMLGYSSEELRTRPFAEYTHPDDIAINSTLFQELHSGQRQQYQVEKRYVRKDGQIAWARLTASIVPGTEGPDCLAIGMIEDISERVQAREHLKKSLEQLRQTLNGFIQAIAVTVEMRDPYTAGHQQRVARLATAMAEEMALPEDQIEGIHLAAVVHDIGKICIPTEILSRPGRLTAIESDMIKTHAEIGYSILMPIDFPWPLAKIVHEHHELMDGSGYPQGLKGDNILLEARILVVADVVEAMASHRPYRPALGMGAALQEISEHRGVLYDPDVVSACLKIIREKRFDLEAGEP